jgi:prepilin-type processing-associated H-X9-DG protein
VAAHAAATDNDNKFPLIEFDKDNNAYTPEEGAKLLPDALKPYGITDVNLKCPEDLKGQNWFAKVRSSYMWRPFSEDEPTVAISVYFRRGQTVANQARVQLCTDYQAVHFPDEQGARKKMNVLYADGHVVSR